jgi:hypothetical protein
MFFLCEGILPFVFTLVTFGLGVAPLLFVINRPEQELLFSILCTSWILLVTEKHKLGALYYAAFIQRSPELSLFSSFLSVRCRSFTKANASAIDLNRFCANHGRYHFGKRIAIYCVS